MFGSNQSDMWNPMVPCHSTVEAWGLAQQAAKRGIDVEVAARQTNLSSALLASRDGAISFSQQMEFVRRLAVTPDDLWCLDAAAALHTTSFGIAGFGLMCSETLGVAIEFVRRFAPLFNLKHTWMLEIRGATACLSLCRGYELQEPHAAECCAYEIIKTVGLLRDATGGAFRAERIVLGTGASRRLLETVTRLAQAPVLVHPGNTCIEFDAQLLHRPLPQREMITYGACIEACDAQLSRVRRSGRASGRVRARLQSSLPTIPGIDEVAKALCLSARSLRRRLESEGSSFQAIAEDVRRETAERLLSTTRLSTEAIADAVGYGDVANFRHAFKRWKGETPRRFRDRSMRTTPIGGVSVLPMVRTAERPRRQMEVTQSLHGRRTWFPIEQTA